MEMKKKGKKKRSWLWDHFELIVKDGDKRSKCVHCKVDVCGDSKMGTSAMKNHIERCKEYPPNVDKSQRLLGFQIEQSQQTLGDVSVGEAIGKAVEKCLLEWGITQAFDLLENSDGGKFFSELTKMSGVPTDMDWDRVASFIPFKIFHDATMRLSGSLYATTNVYLLELVTIGKMIKKKCESVDIRERRKMHYVKWAINDQYDSTMATQLYDMVMGTLTSLYEHYAALQSQNVSSVSENINLTSKDFENYNDWHDVADYVFERDIGGQTVVDKKSDWTKLSSLVDPSSVAVVDDYF
uniref:BED-type domain-containing protein n=1 Tax=Chenopodium quinoa TaxID=63459 RepID=A0A803M801_CHEQI